MGGGFSTTALTNIPQLARWLPIDGYDVSGWAG